MLATFVEWLKGFYAAFLITVYNTVIDGAQAAFDGLCEFAGKVVGWFPAAISVPTNASVPISETATVCIQCLNWIFPMQFLMTMVSFITAGMIAYLVIAPVARWLKLLT